MDVVVRMQRFAKARDVAMAEDCPHSREKAPLARGIRHILACEITNGGLGGRNPYRAHAAACARACRQALTSAASRSAMPFTAASSSITPQNH